MDLGTIISHWKCDETSGVRYDSNTTNSNDLTDNNTVASAAGLLNNACDFENDNDEYLSISNADQVGLNLTSTNFTISMWIKPETLASSHGYSDGLIGKGSGSDGYVWTWDWTNSKFVFNRHDGGGPTMSSAVSSTGTWYHLVSVFDGTNIKWFLNGTLDSTTAYTVHNAPTSAFNIGRSIVNTTRDYDGLIDEITIYSEALTNTEVSQLYNGGTPLLYASTSSSTSSTTTASTTSLVGIADIVFSLNVIIFFLAFLWLGFVASLFKRI